MKLFMTTALLALPISAQAQSLQSLEAATNLGSILAAEQKCSLSYDQDAIGKWIEENTDPSDMGFASSLNMMTQGAEYNLHGMSESATTAHCSSVKRTAKHYGFVK